MDTDRLIVELEAVWDDDEGCLWRLRDSGEMDRDGLEALMDSLKTIDLRKEPMIDRRLVSQLWFIPTFMSWQRERVAENNGDVQALDELTVRAADILLSERRMSGSLRCAVGDPANLVFDPLENLRGMKVIPGRPWATPIDADFQPFCGQVGKPAIPELLPRNLMRAEAGIGWHSLDNLFDPGQAGPERERALPTGVQRCRKPAFIADGPYPLVFGHISGERGPLGSRLSHSRMFGQSLSGLQGCPLEHYRSSRSLTAIQPDNIQQEQPCWEPGSR
jgi:hypothetical protein